MSSLASSLGTCNPRKLRTQNILLQRDVTTSETSRVKILSHPQRRSSSSSSEQVLQLNENPNLLKRREAIGFGFCLGLLDVLLAPQPTQAAEGATCELTVSPSGLAFCDKVVGYGPEAVQGQLIRVLKNYIYIYIYHGFCCRKLNMGFVVFLLLYLLKTNKIVKKSNSCWVELILGPCGQIRVLCIWVLFWSIL